MQVVHACWQHGAAMSKIVFTESYFDTILQITSKRVQNRLLDLLDLLQEVPTFGSRKVRESLRQRFGESCMTADLSPFLLVFEYKEGVDTVYVYGIVHQRSVR